MKLQSFLALLFLAGVLPAASAQTQTYKAAKVVFQNAQMYPQKLLEDAAQIHPGTTFTAAGLDNAAQRLIDTGFFEEVSATLAPGRVDAITVLFTTKPIAVAEMVHLGFENFVWLTPDEIQAALHAKSPLFSGYLPEGSPLVDQLDAVLTQALAARGITAKVTHETFEPTLLRPDRVLEYRIASPRIRVASVKLGGVTPALAPLLQKAVNDVANFGYNDGLAGQTTAEAVLAPLLDAGYARASLSGVSLAPSVTPDAASVVVTASLLAGEVYRVAAVNFPGAPLFPADQFAKSAKLHPGDLASREMLLETLAPLDSAYRRQGYMDVVIRTNPRFDEAAHTVTYDVSLVPGGQYRVNEVIVNDLDPQALSDFNKIFRLTKGELYDPGYVQDFLKSNTSVRSLMPYIGAYKAYAKPDTHTVDLVLTFSRRAL